MNFKEADALARHLTPVLRQLVESQTEPLKKRIAELEERQTKSLKYRGIYSRSQSYAKGDATTHKGSLWVCCKDDPVDGPGTPDWQLIAKAGS